MNTENQDQDFEKLQHLLKLKRYETPPPRYFSSFSGQVLNRIRTGKTGGRYDSFENIVSQTPWLNNLWRAIESQPGIAGSVAALVCALMVAGVFLMEPAKPQNLNFMAVGEDSDAAKAGNDPGPSPLGNNTVAASQPGDGGNAASSLAGANLFEHLSSIRTAPPLVSGTPIWQRPQTNPAALLFR